MAFKTATLRPVRESRDDFDQLEKAILELLRKEIYAPVMAEIGAPQKVITNARSALEEGIRSGRIEYNDGGFTGKFSASSSKELRALGAKWDAKSAGWKLAQQNVPPDIANALASGMSRFSAMLKRIDTLLSKKLPEKIAEKLNAAKFFDSSLWKTNKDFEESVRKVTVSPKLTDQTRKAIAEDWQTNMRRYVKDFSEEQIKKLRKDVEINVLAGNRYESLISKIQDSYSTSHSKAKFLARQETSLMMATFKKTRYEQAGINQYKWRSVVGSAKHPVRPQHKHLAEKSDKGTLYKWSEPPNTAEPNEPARHNNPGEDYNCRCYAIPVVRFKE